MLARFDVRAGARLVSQLVVGRGRGSALAGSFERYGWLTETDLVLLCRARRIDARPGAARDELMALLRSHDLHPLALSAMAAASDSLSSERLGWWTPMSVTELRALARGRNVEGLAGMNREQLVELLGAHGVLRPAEPTSTRRRLSEDSFLR